MSLFSNPAAGEAKQTYSQAYNTAGMLGSEASGIGANLTPFLTQEMLHPTGVGQTGLSAEEAAATGAAGGAGSAFNGMTAQHAAASHNAGGFQAGMDAASRNAAQAGAGASERIAAGNEQLKQQQSQEGAAGLGGLYKTDTSGMLDAMGQEAPDIKAQLAADAAPAPWMSGLGNALNLGGTIAKGLGGFFAPGSRGASILGGLGKM